MSIDVNDLLSTVFICDNLPFLKAIPSESIDLVCIDPPFGKTKTFVGRLTKPLSKEELRIERELMAGWGITDPDSAYHAGLEWPDLEKSADEEGRNARFDDIWSFSKQVYEDWADRIAAENPGLDLLIESTRYTQGDAIAAYIAFMADRMLEIRRILAPTGSIYLHCDNEANAYLRQMMDAVFGGGNFRSEITWPRHTSNQRGSQHLPRTWGNTVDTILFYAKSSRTRVSPYQELTEEEIPAKFPLVDEQGRRYYDDSSHIWSSPNMGARPNLCYTWEKEGYAFTNPHSSGWRLSRERMEEEYAKGNIVILPNGRLQRRKYVEEWRGTTVGSLWDDIAPVAGRERAGYPTQKPQALARRIIEASCPEDGVVLDCFAGCAYVPVAAQLTGRRWIACDMSPRAWTIIRRQFHKHPDLGIMTEGEIAPDPNKPELLAELQMFGKIIKVRGPDSLPEPAPQASQGMFRGVVRKPRPAYHIRAVETDQQIWDAFIGTWGPICWYCGQPAMNLDRRQLQLDHVEPKKDDGSNDDCWNRALACSPCNSDKSNRLTPEQTIHKARQDGRIATDYLVDVQIRSFQDRMAWAKERWEKEVNIQRPLGENPEQQ